MWICFPAKKLCSHCLFTNPEYVHVGLNEGRKVCGLTPWDVEGLPIINSTSKYLTTSNLLAVKDSTNKRPSVLPIILRNTLTLVALEKGLSPPNKKEFGGKPYRYATCSDCLLLGCIRVSYANLWGSKLIIVGCWMQTRGRSLRRLHVDIVNRSFVLLKASLHLALLSFRNP